MNFSFVTTGQSTSSSSSVNANVNDDGNNDDDNDDGTSITNGNASGNGSGRKTPGIRVSLVLEKKLYFTVTLEFTVNMERKVLKKVMRKKLAFLKESYLKQL